jgi:hypothetical protein
LSFHSILRRAVKALDSQMLFDPFEEDLNPPPVPIKLCNRMGWQHELVRNKNK